MLTLALAGSVGAVVTDHCLGEEPARHITLYLDCSGSMSGEKARWLREASKLAIAVLDDQAQVRIVRFSGTAQRSQAFPLNGAAGRLAAMRHIDSLRIRGGTDYVAALRAAPTNQTAAIFVSDGLHGGRREEVLDVLGAQQGSPLYTVAIAAPPEAKALLAEMAAATGGAHTSVEDAEDLVQTLIAIAADLGNYRAYSPDQEELRCRVAAHSHVLAIGYDATASIDAGTAAAEQYTHEGRLPHESVSLVRTRVARVMDVTIRAMAKRSPGGHLAAILRNDLPRATLEITSPGPIGAGDRVGVRTTFTAPDGEPLRPTELGRLQSTFEAVDADGTVVSTAAGRPVPGTADFAAELTAPPTPGPFTIRNTHTAHDGDAAFVGRDERTVMAIEPLQLRVAPNRIEASPKAGRFSIALEVTVESLPDANIAVTAGLAPTHEHLRILRAVMEDAQLLVELRADRPGNYEGQIVIDGNTARPVAPARVPYSFLVRPRLSGLSLEREHDVRLGSHVAGAGEVTVAAWQIPTLDEEPVPYTVVVSDLSQGSSVVPLRAGDRAISPRKDQPAPLSLTADFGNVPPGRYAGTVLMRAAEHPELGEWVTRVTLDVTEPLSARPLDLGAIEVGRRTMRPLIIENAGRPFQNVSLTVGSFTQGDETLDPTDLSVTAPAQLDLLPGMTETTVDFAVTVSPLCEARGPFDGHVIVSRTAGQQLRVPVRMRIVGAGEGPAPLLVTPARVEVAAGPGEVTTFELRVKLAEGERGGTVTAALAALEVDPGSTVPVDFDSTFPGNAQLTRAEPVVIHAFLIAPARAGEYSGTLVIESAFAGSKRVPLSLTVR